MHAGSKAWKPIGVVALWLALLTVAVLPLTLQRGCRVLEAARGPSSDVLSMRALWVTRWDYKSADDVRRIMGEAAAAGFTDVYWQVRGQADAYYRSDLEPWGELIRTSGLPPSFDPLTLAVREAHVRGLRIHAWANVMPLWRGADPPVDPTHLFHTRPEWRLMNKLGEAQALHDGYVIVNPVLDDVQTHIVNVFADIAARYDVDGVHMDYVRFVRDGVAEGVWPGDERSVTMFMQETGRRGVVTTAEREAYDDWIAERITRLVARIEGAVKAARPDVEFSAAVWRRPDIASDTYLQNAGAWIRAGLLDRALPMIYTADDAQLEGDLAAWLDVSAGNPVTPGIGVYKHDDPAQTVRQILMADSGDGYALFGYASLFESVDPNQDKSPEAVAKRKTFRERISAFQRAAGDR